MIESSSPIGLKWSLHLLETIFSNSWKGWTNGGVFAHSAVECFKMSLCESGWRLAVLRTSSETRLGDFRKFLAANFLIKVAQIFGNFLGFFEVCHYIIKKLLWFLLGPVKQNWVKFSSQHLVTLFPSFFSCQSFKCSKIIIYDSGVVLTRKLPTVWLYSRNLRS